MVRVRRRSALLAFALVVACHRGTPTSTTVVMTEAGGGSTATPAPRTLFVGNSFTMVGDLPAVFRRLGAAVAPEPQVESVAYGGYTLGQHVADVRGTGTSPRIRALLGGASGKTAWTHVVLQEQSQIPGFALGNPQRTTSMGAVVPLADLVAATGAVSVLFMTWGYPKGDATNRAIFPDYLTMQRLLEAGYRDMARSIVAAGDRVVIAPVGLAFKAVYEREIALGHDPLAPASPFMQLYGPDQIHPATPGTFLAACVIAATVYGVDPTRFQGSVAGVPEALVADLEAAARDAVAAESAR